MNQHLETILNFIQQSEHLSAEEKTALLKAAKDADKEIEITSFKLDRTEKVKRTTAILLEETIAELEQKRKAVEAQNRELEIESSLERVRTIAMSMKKAGDMLHVCKTISQQLELLNVKEIRNVQTAIFYSEKGTYMNYEYYAKHDNTFITETTYNNNEKHAEFAEKMQKGNGQFFELNIIDSEVNDWIAYQKTTNVFIDDFLYDASSLNYYWHSLGPVALGISTYAPLKEVDKILFRRFLKVFELAYRRYLDIEQAEAQAREAKIEAALEKVRSRSLAMHKSDEIKDVVRTVVEKITELNIEMNGGVSLVTFLPESKDLLHWLWIPEQLDDVFKAYLPYFDHIIFKDCDDAREQELELIGKVYSGEDKQTYFDHLFHQTYFSAGPEEVKQWVMQQPYFGFSFAIQKHSGIFLNDYTGNFFSEETNDILVRFSKVFEQAYVRFLDLQKAEAQSRENQIQLALERARTQSMIMQHSTELDDTLRVFHEQVLLLGIPSAFSFLWLPDEDKDRHIFWAAWAENNSTVFKSKAINYPLDRNESATAQCLVDWKSNQPVVSYHVSPEGVDNYFAAWSELIAGVEQLKPEYFGDGLYYVEAFMKYGCFGVMVKSELQEDEKKILARFAIEFEQTYTRFLDLQKAEAQTRESQIQLALERVRARTMAMQHSDELSETASEMFQQIQSLGLKTWSCGFNIIDKEKRLIIQWVSSGDGRILPSFVTPSDEDVFKRFTQAAEKDKSLYVEEMGGEALKAHYQYMASLPEVKKLLDEFQSLEITPPDFQVFHLASFSYGYLMFITYQPAPEFYDVFKRFANVFDQTYRRFLDLQKAEAQSRESQIQLALERVRARTMAMQHSSELADASFVLDSQVRALGIKTRGCAFNIYGENESTEWFSSEMGSMPLYKTPRENVFLRYYEAGLTGKSIYIEDFADEACTAHYNYLCTVPVMGDALKEMIANGGSFPVHQIDHVTYIKYGYLLFITLEPVPDAHDIFIRFAKVFEQTYTRFLDLQKAEAQSRESQIQLALERVRARTMAMHQSNELADTASVLFHQIKELGFETWSCGFCIWTKNDLTEVWMAADSGGLLPPMMIPYKEEPTHAEIYKASLRKEPAHDKIWEGKELEKHYAFLKTIPSVKTAIEILEKSGLTLPSRQCYYVGFFKEGYLLLITKEPNEGLKNLSKRFASVFDLTYTRFLDLQKAEAQARESQIEAALERVRSRSMGMQKSEELKEVIQIVYQQLTHLNIHLDHAGFVVDYVPKGNWHFWIADEQDIPAEITHPYFESVWATQFNEAKEKGTNFFVTHLNFEEKNKFYNELLSYVSGLPEASKDFYLSRPGLAATTVLFDNVSLYIENFEGIPYSDEDNKTLMRFGKVFQQTYTRFNDLKHAEAQAKEAKIEAALDRVRSVAMSMMKSDELMAICEAVFKQLQILGFTGVRAAQIYIRHDEHEKFMNYDYSETTGADVVEVSYNSHPNTRRIYDVIRTAGDALVDNAVTKQQLDEWKSYLYNTLKQPPDKSLDNATELHYYLYSFGMGAFGICTFKTINDDELQILKRFRNVFSLSYQRYSDIALAETQAREAKIEAALERVRSRTLAMQKSDELAETSAVLFKQLINLGISPNRLYISIIKDEEGETEFWITDEDGSKVSMAYEDNLNNNPSFKKMYDGWKQQKKSSVIDMKGKELKNYFNYLSSIHVPFKGGLTQKRRVQYIAYFSKGFIGMASPDEQPAETLQLLERFAYVFNLTFTRFNDLQIAEAHALQAEHDLIEIKAARKKAEETLVELQSTQKQLVQSEKMASLGELTAGIAHEIQNPLNFVNNFSEVSKELLDEMNAALESGDEDEAKEIVKDVIQNLEKINHHGKRADAIVKGMLQHSRKSEGVKELTDINALCDEYVRLCYHGLKAKDKNFNADFKMDFDESIGKINIVPQDIGRVLLNLFNNAFYATNERQKAEGESYKPIVSIQTKKIKGSVELTVKDNGNGISQKVVDKIFQPFFTTKPTGEGTGLGLSLAYDIIKAHGGIIEVESKEGEGSKFIIVLPVKLLV